MTARRAGVAAALVAAVGLALPVTLAAQRGETAKPAAPAKPAPRLADGKPDFSGVWSGGGGFNPRNVKPGDTIELLPAAKKLMDTRTGKWAEDPEAHCLPTGVPRMAPYPWRMVQSVDGKYVFILFEGNIHSYRQIFLDGRPHPKDPDPTWYGHSTGRWEGDTLVVDTVGYNDKFWFSAAGWPHTTQLHTVERFTRTDFNTLSWDITITDPGAYAKPFTLQTRARLEPSWDLMEYICQENNTNIAPR
jgi:hypothetical protein